MKATLEFNLPEDKYEWENAVNADRMMRALWDINDELRTKASSGEGAAGTVGEGA